MFSRSRGSFHLDVWSMCDQVRTWFLVGCGPSPGHICEAVSKLLVTLRVQILNIVTNPQVPVLLNSLGHTASLLPAGAVAVWSEDTHTKITFDVVRHLTKIRTCRTSRGSKL